MVAPYRAVFPGVIFLYTILCRIVNFLLTWSIEFETLTLRAGNTPRNSAYGQSKVSDTGKQSGLWATHTESRIAASCQT